MFLPNLPLRRCDAHATLLRACRLEGPTLESAGIPARQRRRDAQDVLQPSRPQLDASNPFLSSASVGRSRAPGLRVGVVMDTTLFVKDTTRHVAAGS
jgi:hypothetical protein